MVTIVHPVLPAAGRLICGPRPSRPFRAGLAALVDARVSTIACLLDDHEMPAELVAAYDTSALTILRYAIADFGRPADAGGLAAYWAWAIQTLRYSLGNEYLKANEPARAAEHLVRGHQIGRSWTGCVL